MRAEWVLVDSALHAYSLVSVPLYDTLGPDAVEYITNHAELAAVACSAAVAPNIVSVLHKCPTVKVLVSTLLRGQALCAVVTRTCCGPQWDGGQPIPLSSTWHHRFTRQRQSLAQQQGARGARRVLACVLRWCTAALARGGCPRRRPAATAAW